MISILSSPRSCRSTYDTRDVHLWAVNLHVELELLSHVLDVLETLLEIGSGTTNPDLYVVLDEDLGKLSESADDTLECGSNVGEVGNTTSDEEDLALWIHGRSEHEIKNSSGVEVSIKNISIIPGKRARFLTFVSRLEHQSTLRSWQGHLRNRKKQWHRRKRRKHHHQRQESRFFQRRSRQ